MQKVTHYLFPGTFDPFTVGHLDLALRASKLADKVTIVVLHNSEKKTVFNLEERINLVLRTVKHYDNIDVIGYEGLIAECYRELSATAVIRGLRDGNDFAYEAAMADINQTLNPQYETIFLKCRNDLSYIRSSVVKEIASYGGDFSTMIPTDIYEEVLQRLRAE